MVASIPHIIYVYLLDGCTHALCTFISFHYVPMYQRYQLYLHLQVLHDGVLFQFWFHKAFHPSHSLGLHDLGGIYYIVFCHRPHIP